MTSAQKTDMQDQPLLIAEGLTKRYGRQIGCRDVSFELYEGEVIAVVGESGSGKSTLLQLLCAQLEATTGRVLYRMRDGLTRDLASLGEAERRFLARTDWGYVHQDPSQGLRMAVSAGANVGERLMAVDTVLREAAAAVLDAHGLVLEEVELGREGGMPRLRLVVDLPEDELGSADLDTVAEASRELSARIDADGFAVTSVTMGSHSGTHVDAPSHTVAGGRMMDDVDVARLIGRAHLLRVPGLAPRERIGLARLEDQLAALPDELWVIQITPSTIDEVLVEIANSTLTERGATRADDRLSESAMEDRKKEGYF